MKLYSISVPTINKITYIQYETIESMIQDYLTEQDQLPDGERVSMTLDQKRD